ncbi:hypothetical protein ZZ1p0071 [Acinetobacter phage ZZ1]|jgi:hypothetical protein|uniref:Uncharacterized protein n=3 Tax=Caudoviricetes TaxID=2731619 RepID=A0A410T5K9_9CAUD|nr:hypothetical protein ZZ1p0071 [Acinetobacter phage ZZ1]AFL47542.1 hypothetical protein ZZ1p0071 [Acinetobacter phage ZZ1]QAU03929.1 hypothetical protein Henu6_gp124 [Acinetobacter phage Henu6]
MKCILKLNGPTKLKFPLLARRRMHPNSSHCITVLFTSAQEGTVVQADAKTFEPSFQIGYHSKTWPSVQGWDICPAGTTIQLIADE